MHGQTGVRVELPHIASIELVQPDALLPVDDRLINELLSIGRPTWSLHRLEILRELPGIPTATRYYPDIATKVDREPTIFRRVHRKAGTSRDGDLRVSRGSMQQSNYDQN